MRKTFIVVGGFGSGKWDWVENKRKERNRECYVFDKITTIPNIFEIYSQQVRADRDIYIITTDLKNIPLPIVKSADKVIRLK